ncbi:MAG: 4Fe-4S binding protein [Mycobacterium sp.]
MIELVSAQRCIACDKCIEVCPTNVFDRGPGGVPLIGRHSDCQTCFQCEANCPVDALFVSPLVTPAEVEEEALVTAGLLGSYRERIGWGKGRAPGARNAIGPALEAGAEPLIS